MRHRELFSILFLEAVWIILRAPLCRHLWTPLWRKLISTRLLLKDSPYKVQLKDQYWSNTISIQLHKTLEQHPKIKLKEATTTQWVEDNISSNNPMLPSKPIISTNYLRHSSCPNHNSNNNNFDNHKYLVN